MRSADSHCHAQQEGRWSFRQQRWQGSRALAVGRAVLESRLSLSPSELHRRLQTSGLLAIGLRPVYSHKKDNA